jgi:hypothetical protein
MAQRFAQGGLQSSGECGDAAPVSVGGVEAVYAAPAKFSSVYLDSLGSERTLSLLVE